MKRLGRQRVLFLVSAVLFLFPLGIGAWGQAQAAAPPAGSAAAAPAPAMDVPLNVKAANPLRLTIWPKAIPAAPRQER